MRSGRSKCSGWVGVGTESDKEMKQLGGDKNMTRIYSGVGGWGIIII